jgi:hypothetical protein
MGFALLNPSYESSRYNNVESVVRLFLSICVFLLLADPALAGSVITSETSGPKEAAGKSVVYIEPDRVRIESPQDVTIYRGDQNLAYILNPAQKRFVRLTPEKMKEMAAAMETARTEMAEQLKSMPPAQRAQVEKMMAGDMPSFSFRKAAGGGTVGKWKCEKVEQLANGEPQATLCVVKTSEIGLNPDDLAPLQRFSAFMLQAAPQAAAASAAMDPQALEKTVGYPAYAVQMEIPAAKMKTVTKSVENKTNPADLFEIPAGYQEEAMPTPGSDAGGARGPARR